MIYYKSYGDVMVSTGIVELLMRQQGSVLLKTLTVKYNCKNNKQQFRFSSLRTASEDQSGITHVLRSWSQIQWVTI